MADNTYSITEIVGSSTEGIDDAIKGAVSRASKTLHNLDWFEVTGMRGRIEDDGRCHFQVTVKVGFRLDEQPTCPAPPVWRHAAAALIRPHANPARAPRSRRCA
jgi:flavin-binding protein dodecin